MKKFLATALALLTIPFSASAVNGDVAGKIYSTDIRAFINDIEVQSYNIGGKTAVVIEDILSAANYYYDNYTRTLSISRLSPEGHVEHKSECASVSGNIIGNIYETDIKTYIYDVLLPSYNIGGKTAVVIEDLGNDDEFSPIGGKYEWNGTERTIKLEFLWQNSSIIPNDKNIYITANEDMTEADATFEEVLHCNGGSEHFNWPDYVTDDANIEVVLPIKAQGEIIGYYLRRPSDFYKFTAFTYYYPEKLEEAAKIYTPYPWKTRENIISHFISTHSVGEPRERFDTENYSFIYISIAMVGSTPHYLLQVNDDGTYIDYKEQIATRNRSPHNLVIDKENEKVTFSYVDRYNGEWFTNYEIDLKTKTIKEV